MRWYARLLVGSALLVATTALSQVLSPSAQAHAFPGVTYAGRVGAATSSVFISFTTSEDTQPRGNGTVLNVTLTGLGSDALVLGDAPIEMEAFRLVNGDVTVVGEFRSTTTMAAGSVRFTGSSGSIAVNAELRWRAQMVAIPEAYPLQDAAATFIGQSFSVPCDRFCVTPSNFDVVVGDTALRREIAGAAATAVWLVVVADVTNAGTVMAPLDRVVQLCGRVGDATHGAAYHSYGDGVPAAVLAGAAAEFGGRMPSNRLAPGATERMVFVFDVDIATSDVWIQTTVPFCRR